MNQFSRIYLPLPRLFLPFCVGVLLYLQLGWQPDPPYLLLISIAISLPWLFNVLIKPAAYARQWIFGFLVAVVLLAAGYMMAAQFDQYDRERHFKNWYGEDGFLLVHLIEPTSERANSWQLITKVVAFSNDSGMQDAEGRLMLYLEKDSLVEGLRYGDRLVIRNRYNNVRPPGNPGAFNYQRYLARQNIFHSTYIRSGEWHITGENKGRHYMRLALQLREVALAVFRENNLEGREFAVISALLLGFREYLDEDLRREFAGAGAMHILCVSGLHVGIIFMVLKNVFAFLLRLPGGRFLRTACIIMLIWLYAAITGFSPSVLRASVMFSFVAMGQSFRRPTNIYNTLAASAFVLVINNPFIITHIGFQLSYLAVISIVSLQPWLQGLIRVKKGIPEKTWSIITVSIAAQLATGPLALHYFHQFPNYFIVTNLIVIPLATVIIYLALITLLVSPLAIAGAWMGQILSAAVMVLHQSVRLIEGLPYSTASNVYVGFFETLMVFMCLFFLFYYLMKGKRWTFLTALGLLCGLVLSVSVRNIENRRQQYFVVYSINRGAAVDFITGKETILLACDNVNGNPRLMRFNVMANRLKRGVRQDSLSLAINDNDLFVKDQWFVRKDDFIRFNGMTMMILRDAKLSNIADHAEMITGRVDEKPQDSLFPFPVDYMLITQNPRMDISSVLEYVRPRKVIIDASNSAWNVRRMEEACMQAGVDFHNVRTGGAYVSK